MSSLYAKFLRKHKGERDRMPIAVSSIVREMAKGKTLEEARKITPALVAEGLERLPKNKYHCSNLGA